MDIGKEGADGKSEGMMQFVGKSHREDVPWSIVGDHLILYALCLVSLCSLLNIHLKIQYYYRLIGTTRNKHHRDKVDKNWSKEGRTDISS